METADWFLDIDSLAKREQEGIWAGDSPEQMAVTWMLPAADRVVAYRENKIDSELEDWRAKRTAAGGVLYTAMEEQQRRQLLAQQWAPVDFTFLESP